MNPLDSTEFRRQGHMVIDFLADYYQNIHKYSVRSQVKPGYLLEKLPDCAPSNPESVETILNDVQRDILPGITHWQSPKFFAYFASSGSNARFLGEMLLNGFNVVGFNWLSSPEATELEMVVMEWLLKLLQLPKSFSFSSDGGGGILLARRVRLSFVHCLLQNRRNSGKLEVKTQRNWSSIVLIKHIFPYIKQPKFNLCFADDLFIFLRGNVESASVIMTSLEEFKVASGLAPSLTKSTAYFCNVINSVKLAILNILPFEEGRLPVKYLGVPLVSSRLVIRDCKDLIEKVKKRVNDWRNKYLSFAGRLQLIKSVISSINVYWSSVFILPMSIILDIEQIMRRFLWCQGDMQKGKAKVAWDDVCLPYEEGGLGIRKLHNFNIALFSYHIWSILTSKVSLWVKWVHSNRLRGKSFWDTPYRGSLPWSWRKMLQIRPLVRKFFWFKIGNGRSAHAWSDNWCVHSPLYDVIAANDITSAGFSLDARVRDLITNGEWNWPMHWTLTLPNITLPILNNGEDLLYWKDRDGNLKDFSVSVVWNDLRPRKNKVDWSEIVWFSCCIPRHAFILWLVFRKKLKTQDILMQWDWNPSMDLLCPFCKLVPDSHSHLFFDCPFTMQIWNQVTKKVGPLPIPSSSSSWSAIIANLMPRAKRNSLHAVLEKLVLAASVYFVWQERNARLFTKTARSPNVLSETIIATIKLKLVTLRYKRTSSVERLLAAWDLPVSLINNV